jgi:hypothetical protein
MCPGRQRSWRSISLSCYRHQHLPASLELSRHQFVLLSFPPLLFLLSQCCLRYLLATSAVYVPAFGLPFSRFLFVDFLSLSVVLCHFSWLPRFALSSLACSLIVSCSSILCPSFFLCHLLVAVVVYNFVIGLAFCCVLFLRFLVPQGCLPSLHRHCRGLHLHHQSWPFLAHACPLDI